MFRKAEVFSSDVMGGVAAKMAGLILSCCMSEQENAQRSRSRRIDKMLAKEKGQIKRTVKILLLGAGESGKSTFLKQMKIIYGKEFDDEALVEFRNIIYGNIIKGMRVLIDAREKLAIPFGGDANLQKDAKYIFGFDPNTKLNDSMFGEYVLPMKRLWSDSGIASAFDRRREFQLVSSITMMCHCLAVVVHLIGYG